MNYISFFIKFLYRIRYWLIFIPLNITLIAIYQIKHSTQHTAQFTQDWSQGSIFFRKVE